jgi:hypothetical protein
MRNIWFKLFGDGKVFAWVFWGAILVQLFILGLIVWIAYHFITKYW